MPAARSLLIPRVNDNIILAFAGVEQPERRRAGLHMGALIAGEPKPTYRRRAASVRYPWDHGRGYIGFPHGIRRYVI